MEKELSYYKLQTTPNHHTGRYSLHYIFSYFYDCRKEGKKGKKGKRRKAAAEDSDDDIKPVQEVSSVLDMPEVRLDYIVAILI